MTGDKEEEIKACSRLIRDCCLNYVSAREYVFEKVGDTSTTELPYSSCIDRVFWAVF